MKRYLTAVVASTFLLAIAGCNTVAGAGKDVQKAGEKTEQKAKEVQKK